MLSKNCRIKEFEIWDLKLDLASDFEFINLELTLLPALLLYTVQPLFLY